MHTEVSREGEGGVWSGQRGRRGGQDQTFSVACATTIKERERKEGEHVKIILRKFKIHSLARF